MLILFAKSGQLGNQLGSLSSAIALGLEYGHDVCCPIVDPELKKYFNFTFSTEKSINIRVSYRKTFEFIAKLIVFFKNKFNINNNCKFDSDKSKYNPQIMTHWISFREDRTLVTQYENVREYLGFKKEIYDRCYIKFSKLNLQGKKLMAVHFRRGDYKLFNGGKWYYENEDFLSWMKMIYDEDNSLHFLIFSNEKVDLNIFRKYNLPVSIMDGTAIEDLCCMSKCDYIMGPPSTFSWWASYIGNSKLLWLEERGKDYHLNNFFNICEEIIKNHNS